MEYTFIILDGNSERAIHMVTGEQAENAIGRYLELNTIEAVIAKDEACEIQFIVDENKTTLVLYA